MLQSSLEPPSFACKEWNNLDVISMTCTYKSAVYLLYKQLEDEHMDKLVLMVKLSFY